MDIYEKFTVRTCTLLNALGIKTTDDLKSIDQIPEIGVVIIPQKVFMNITIPSVKMDKRSRQEIEQHLLNKYQ